MSVVEVKFRANADFSDLVKEANAANLAVENLNKSFTAMQRGKIDELVGQFHNTLRNSNQFTVETVKMASASDKFGEALNRQKLTLKEYHRAMTEFRTTQGGLIRDLARQQTMLERSRVVSRGRDSNGNNIMDVITPTGLDKSLATKASVARKELQILNKVLNDGATSLINWGKQTQWAGRQLTVGLTVPLTLLGGAAAKVAFDIDQQLTRIVKVYGNTINNIMSPAQVNQLKKQLVDLSSTIAETYGQTAQETLGLAADIAATGKTGKDLTESVLQTTRLATLGEVDRQEAMKATLAIQSAFKQNTDQLAESVNFLNAVENQTSTSLQDLVEAIPKAGPVVEGLGGSVKDLALMMVAMREGGIPAAEAANAIKSGLASIINPTKQSREMLQGFNIDINKIQKDANGELIPMLMGLKKGLDGLDAFSRSQVIEQMFGKFQFARMTALFNNLGESGSQTVEVLKLMGSSAEDLGKIADRELATLQNSISGQFTRALEKFKIELAGIGEGFIVLATKGLNALSWIFEKFDAMPDVIKKAFGGVGLIVAIIGPIIMTVGVLGNLLGYLIKGIAAFKAFGNSGVKNWALITKEETAAKAAGDLMERSFYNQTTAAQTLAGALQKLVQELAGVSTAGQAAASGINSALAGASKVAADKAKQAVIATTGLPTLIVPRSLDENGREKGEFTGTGVEFSHLYPNAKKDYAIGEQGKKTVNGVGVSRLLAGSSAVSESHAKTFQQKMGTDMQALTIGFLDETEKDIDGVRKKILTDLATDSGRISNEIVRESLGNMTAVGRAQLLPTIQEFKRTNVAYTARVQALANLGPDQLKKFTAVVNQEFARTGSRYKALESAWRSNPSLEASARVIANSIEQQVDSIIRTEKDLATRAKKIVQAVDEVESRARAKLAATQGVIGSRAAAGVNFVDGSNAGRRQTEGDLMTFSYNESRAAEGTKIRSQQYKLAMELRALQKNGSAEAIAEKRAEIRALIALQREEKNALVGIKQQETATLIGLQEEQNVAAGGGSGRRGGRFSRFGGKGGMIGGALIGGTMLASGIQADGPVGDTVGVVGGASMGAQLGMMAGPWGAAIGGVLGALATGIPMIISKNNEMEAGLKSLSTAGELAADKMGASFKALADVQLVNLIGKTTEAQQKFQELVDAFAQAGEGTADAAFVQMVKEADFAGGDLQGILGDKITTLIASNVKPEDIKSYVAAVMTAAGRDSEIPQILSNLGMQISQNKTESILAQLTSGTTSVDVYGRYGFSGKGSTIQPKDEDEARRLSDLMTGLSATSGSNGKLNELNDILQKVGSSLFTIDTIINTTEGNWKTFAENIKNSGGNTQDMMRLIALEASDMKLNFEELSKNPYRINVIFQQYEANQSLLGLLSNVGKDAFNSNIEKLSADSEKATGGGESEEAFNKRKQALAKAQQERVKSVQDYYDKLIDAEKKKEDALRKIQEAENRRLEREKAMRDSQVSYNEAISSGNFGQAALIKNNMQAQKAGWALEDKQRLQDEAAQSRLQKLEAAKEKAVDAEQKRLDKINEMTYVAVTKQSTIRKKANDEQIKNERAAQKLWEDILGQHQGNVMAALQELIARQDDFKQQGIDISGVLTKAITSLVPGVAPEVTKMLLQNLPNAPWSALGAAIQAKIEGDPKAFEAAFNELNSWANKTTTSKVDSQGRPTGQGQSRAADYYTGGYVAGQGHGTSDQIDARLSNGEYVVKNSAVSFYGKGMLDQINQRKFADGGMVDTTSTGLLSRIFAGATYRAMAATGTQTVGSAPADLGAGSIAGGGSSKVAGSGLGARLASLGMSYLGVPYSYTSANPQDGWGCAPFVHYLYKQFGYNIPGGYVSNNQYNAIRNHPDRASLSAGDLVFFKYANGLNTGNAINHVGMYTGNGNMVHAANPRQGTISSGVDWTHYKGAARPVDYDSGLRNYANGGLVAMVKPGEFMINDGSVKKYGTGLLNSINNQTYHGGGLVTSSGPRREGIASGGGNEYNFIIHGDGADPEAIADKVMAKIKTVESRKGSGR